MEDLEFVPENSALRHYLDSLYLYDACKEDTVKQGTCHFPIPISAKAKQESSAESIDKDVIEQIEELISARMLFEENVANIEKLVSGFKVVKIGMLRSIFENVSGFIVIVLGLCVYWAIGSYVFFVISIYYAYNAADYLWRKHFNQRRLKQLTDMLKANYTLFRRTLKFIKDNDNIVKLNLENNKNHVEYNLYHNLKQEFAQAENEVILLLMKATRKLIDKFPFYDYIEDPYCYFCYSYDRQLLKFIDESKLFHVYLLVQSEFLQRLAMSLIPNIKKSGKQNSLELYRIVKETSIMLRRLENKFSKKFKFVFLRGIYEPERVSLSTSQKSKSACVVNHYRNDLMNNIQDMSNSFQKLLIRSRTIENNLSNEEQTEMMLNELADIQNELNVCQRNISDSLIVLKKFSSKNRDEDGSLKENSSSEVEVEDHKPIDLQEESPVEDEIFEAYFHNEMKNENEEENDFDDFMKKKVEREYSRLVLKELKSKLVEKVKEWEVREENAVFKKFGEQEVPDQHSLNKELIDHDTSCMNSDSQCEKQYFAERNVCDGGTDCDGITALENNYCCESSANLQAPNSSFLADIFKAREKLIKSPACEDYFCNSDGEDSNE